MPDCQDWTYFLPMILGSRNANPGQPNNARQQVGSRSLHFTNSQQTFFIFRTLRELNILRQSFCRPAEAESHEAFCQEDKALGPFGIHLPLIYGKRNELLYRRPRKEMQTPQTVEHTKKYFTSSQLLITLYKRASRNPPDLEVQSCMQDLQITCRDEDMKLIEDMKGGLLRDSYQLILEPRDLQQ